MARPRAASLKYSRKMALPIARGMRASALHEPDLRGGLLRPSGEPLLSSGRESSWMRNSQIGGTGFREAPANASRWGETDKTEAKANEREIDTYVYNARPYRINNARTITRVLIDVFAGHAGGGAGSRKLPKLNFVSRPAFFGLSHLELDNERDNGWAGGGRDRGEEKWRTGRRIRCGFSRMGPRPSPFKSRCVAMLNFKNGVCILSAPIALLSSSSSSPPPLSLSLSQ